MKLLWKEKTGKAMGSYSAIRWWSKWEVMLQVCQYFRDVEAFLTENNDVSPATWAKLLTFFSHPNKKVCLHIQLAAIIDWGEPFVKATYKLEGDGPLVLQCYEVIDTVRAIIKAANTPNLLAVAEKLSGGVAHNKKLMIDHAQQCVQPAIDYFNGHLSSTLQRPLEAFKAAHYFLPQKVHEIQHTASSIDCLKAFPIFDSKDLEGLKGELQTWLKLPMWTPQSI